MSLPITTSPDITLLDYSILYDLSGATPTIVLTNASVGNPSGTTNLNLCNWWYVITTPSGVFIHQGSATSPDITAANWTTLEIPENAWPTPFGVPPYGQVEFSCGAPYVCTLYVQDTDDNVFSLAKRVAICRPNGNTEKTKGNFGVAAVAVTVKCDIAKIYTNDTTNYTYQNRIGEFNSNTWKLAYPMDDQGNTPTPITVSDQGRVIFPVRYNAEGYQISLNTIASYDMGSGQTVKFQYKFYSVFAVLCNVDLCCITCEVDKLYKQLSPRCGTVSNPEIQDKLFRIDVLLGQCLIGINQPLCGIDVPAKIREIKRIGGFDCECGTIGGINPIASTDGLINIELDLEGAIEGSVTNVGDNYVIHLQIPGTAAGTLQVVTNNGNTTTNDIVVGNTGAANSRISPTKIEIHSTPSELLAGLGQASTPGSQGSLWLHRVGQGTFYMQPHASSNTWIMVLPQSQGGAGQTWINDGSGNMSWGSAIGNLQTVTAAGNITTLDIISGVAGAKTGTVNPEYFLVEDTGVAIAKFGNLPVVGAGFQLKGNSNSFLATVYNNSAIANRAFTLPRVRDGQFAQTGLGTTCTITADTGAGTSPTVSVSGTHTCGFVTVLAGSAPATGAVIVKINLGVEYVTAGVIWRALISPGNSAAGIFQGITIQSPFALGLPGGDAFYINSGVAPLVSGTTYIWYYHINY